MTRKLTGRPNGRTPKDPSSKMPEEKKKKMWAKIDDLLRAGCTGTEIASTLDMHPQTFYDKVLQEKLVSFTEYSSKRKEEGDSLLRAAQFSNALKGNTTMQIFLGKVRLKQVENPEQLKVDQEMLTKYEAINNQLRDLRGEKDVPPPPYPLS
jgi:hypothetical protein